MEHLWAPACPCSGHLSPALTSAKKGLQLHRLLRGDLQSSPGSGGKEGTGHRIVCLAAPSPLPLPAASSALSSPGSYTHLSPSGAPLLSLCLPLFPPSALAADPLISGCWFVFFSPLPEVGFRVNSSLPSFPAGSAIPCSSKEGTVRGKAHCSPVGEGGWRGAGSHGPRQVLQAPLDAGSSGRVAQHLRGT